MCFPWTQITLHNFWMCMVNTVNLFFPLLIPNNNLFLIFKKKKACVHKPNQMSCKNKTFSRFAPLLLHLFVDSVSLKLERLLSEFFFFFLLRQMVLQCTNAKEHLVLMSGILAALTNWQYFNTQGMRMGWLFLSVLMEI